MPTALGLSCSSHCLPLKRVADRGLELPGEGSGLRLGHLDIRRRRRWRSSSASFIRAGHGLEIGGRGGPMVVSRKGDVAGPGGRVGRGDVTGHRDHRRSSLGDGGGDGGADHGVKLGRIDEPADVQGGGREECVRVQFLQGFGVDERGFDVAGDGDHGSRFLTGVDQAVDQVGGPGPGCAADGHRLTGETGVGHGCEGTEFLVPDVDELNRAVASHRIDRRVECVADDAIAPSDPGGHQHFPQSIGTVFAIGFPPGV